MEALQQIRQLYIPVQPTVKQQGSNVVYREFAPCAALQNFIYCYWQLHTTAPLAEQFNYKVVADGCIDIFFELDNPAENYVMGFCRKYTEFALGHTFNYVGVRFFPTVFPQLFQTDASELSNRYEYLKLVHAGSSSFIENSFATGQDIADITQLFDAYFLGLLAKTSFDNDGRLYDAIGLILQNHGMVDIESSLPVGISSRQLRRLFQYYIGDTGKTFSKVVRFQNILRAKPSAQSLRQNKLFFDAGYYDQSHFIKEFKNFYGLTPASAFGR